MSRRPAELLVIVPSLGRPESVPRIMQAWDDTNGWADADLLFAIDADDPTASAYSVDLPPSVHIETARRWRPLVAKLNRVAVKWSTKYWALAFMGDDHLPRTPGWARAYLDALHELGTGIVYGDDLHRREALPTQWAVTADIVRALGRMIPAPVRQQFCDRSVMVLGQQLGRLQFLPEVTIEHMHYAVDKGVKDSTATLGNRAALFRADCAVFERWLNDGAQSDVERVVQACGLR